VISDGTFQMRGEVEDSVENGRRSFPFSISLLLLIFMMDGLSK